MKILVIDGQSGRLGSQVIESLRKALPECLYTITAVGANALATSAMLRAGAHQAATGENAVVVQCRTANLIVGPVGIAIADALLGRSPRRWPLPWVRLRRSASCFRRISAAAALSALRP